jgi:hypothetical protein
VTLLLCLLAPLRAVAAAIDTGAVLEYAVRYGPLQIMEMRTTTRLEGDRYHASTDVRTVGVAGVLFPWQASSGSLGVRGDNDIRPIRYHTAGEYRGRRRTAELDYQDGEIHVRIDPPPELDDRDPVPATLQRGTVDPITATLSAVLSGCRGQLRVFDGRRRYDVTLNDLGDAETPSSRHGIYSGTARHCRAVIKTLAGFWRSEPRHDERPSQVDCWLAVPRPGLLAVPVYLEMSAPRGTLAIHLSAAEPLTVTSAGGGEAGRYEIDPAPALAPARAAAPALMRVTGSD